MTWGITVNGVDLSGLGLYIMETSGGLGAAERPVQRVSIPGRAGSVLSFPSSEAGGVFTVRGGITSTAKTTAAREAAEDQVKDALRSGLVRVTRDNGSTTARQIVGTVRRIDLSAIGHPFTTSDSRGRTVASASARSETGPVRTSPRAWASASSCERATLSVTGTESSG